MTDEEMAKEYAEENKEIYGSDEYADITDYNNIKEAYLAGLKAGRPKWHDLRKNSEDLPPARKVVFISGYLGDMKDLHGFDEWDGEKWLNMDMPGLVREAWCEIPTFGED